MEPKKTGFGVKTVILIAVISVLAGILLTAKLDMTNTGEAQSFWKESGEGVPQASIRPDSFVDIAKRLSPSVVNISTTQIIKERPIFPFPEFRGPFGGQDDFFGDDFNKFFNNDQQPPPPREMKRQSLGSGFIINKDGYILTNFHVIENATEIMVTLSEHKKDYKAKVVGQDPKLDIALIKINADADLPAITIGNSDDLQIGEWVVAIGNPFGLGGTVTAGIVSQKGRVIGAGPYDNFIQTDASINPGNSGGPLFNMRGQVVGINTAIVAGGQGIGFATPINMVKDVLVQLKEKGKITRGWIGVGIQELTPELAKSFGLKDADGALISSVNPGDPADAAGLKQGDIIISFDNKKITEMNDLPRIVAGAAPGKSVPVVILRDGQEKTITLKVGAKSDEEAFAEADTLSEKEPKPDKRLGISVQSVTPEMAKKLGLPDTEGVVIMSIRPDSPAGLAALRRGDVIKEVNRKPVRNLSEYKKTMAALNKKDSVLLLIKRGNSTIYVILTVKEK